MSLVAGTELKRSTCANCPVRNWRQSSCIGGCFCITFLHFLCQPVTCPIFSQLPRRLLRLHGYVCQWPIPHSLLWQLGSRKTLDWLLVLFPLWCNYDRFSVPLLAVCTGILKQQTVSSRTCCQQCSVYSFGITCGLHQHIAWLNNVRHVVQLAQNVPQTASAFEQSPFINCWWRRCWRSCRSQSLT